MTNTSEQTCSVEEPVEPIEQTDKRHQKGVMEMTFLDHEQMRILVLDTKNQVVENISRYQGTVNSSVLRAAEVYRPAIIRNCPGVIICHNHPSGDPTPSPEDIAVTRQLVEAGKVLDIELVDHLVIGNHRFVSLKERMRW